MKIQHGMSELIDDDLALENQEDNEDDEEEETKDFGHRLSMSLRKRNQVVNSSSDSANNMSIDEQTL